MTVAKSGHFGSKSVVAKKMFFDLCKKIVGMAQHAISPLLKSAAPPAQEWKLAAHAQAAISL